MTRYLITLEYVGGGFHGFQRQRGIDTVQGAIEQALTRFTGEEPRVQGSGRTDTGVHALAQIAAFDLARELDPDSVMASLNGLLPGGISVTGIRLVRDGFDPRREALWREYRYFILHRKAPSALLAGYACHISKDLDREAMAQACSRFVGEHDFSAYRIKGGQDLSTVRNILECELSEPKPDILCMRVRANAFLYRMVRIMAGAAVAAGYGRKSVEDVAASLEGGEKPFADALAAHGLFLWKVAYPEDIYLD